MKPAIRTLDSAARAYGAKDAWTAFWQDPVQSRCVAGSVGIQQRLSAHWAEFANSLTPGDRVLDLGCGAGAVARELLAARRDLQITGVDFARVPLTIHPQVDLLSDTAMERLPFAEASFGAAVSQFGCEYSQLEWTSREVARVLGPDARLSLLVHHADSSIVATNRCRFAALEAFLSPAMRAAFCAADVAAFSALLAALVDRHPHDSLVSELARSLPTRLGRAPRERIAIWNAIEDALAPERCLAAALNTCCVAAADIDRWLAPLRRVCVLQSITVIQEPDGAPVAWGIAGARAKN